MGLGRVWVGRVRVVTVVIGIGVAMSLTSGCSSKQGEGELDSESSLTEGEFGADRGSLAAAKAGRSTGGGRFEEIYFAYDSDDLDGAATQAVRYNAELLRAEKGRIEIEGHCDERGTAEYNLALGARRAKAVRDGLVAVGISSSRLSTVSYGEELPVCREPSESCWSQNRRGHLVDLTE